MKASKMLLVKLFLAMVGAFGVNGVNKVESSPIDDAINNNNLLNVKLDNQKGTDVAWSLCNSWKKVITDEKSSN